MFLVHKAQTRHKSLIDLLSSFKCIVISYLCNSVRTIRKQWHFRSVKQNILYRAHGWKQNIKSNICFNHFFLPWRYYFLHNWFSELVHAINSRACVFDDEITFSTLLDCMRLLEVENIAEVIINLIHNILKLYCGWQRAESIVEFPSALEQWLWWIALTLQISEAAVACLIKERIGERVIKASKQQWQWAELPDRGHSMKNGSFTIPINQLYLV